MLRFVLFCPRLAGKNLVLICVETKQATAAGLVSSVIISFSTDQSD